MANIKKHLDNIKGALYGKDVRSSIHDGIDAINKEVESTTGRQVDLESTFDQLVINAGNSNAEIVDARVKSDGTSYSKLGDRLNEVDSQLEHIATLVINNIDDVDEVNNKIATIEKGKIIFNCSGVINKSLVLLNKSNIDVEFINGSELTINKHGWCGLEIVNSNNIKITNFNIKGSGMFLDKNYNNGLGGGEKHFSSSNCVEWGYSRNDQSKVLGAYNGGYIGNSGSGIFIENSSNVIIENCDISKFNYCGVTVQGGTSKNIIIRNNEIYNCYDGGVSVRDIENYSIYDNNIHDIGHPNATNGDSIVDPGYGITLRASFNDDCAKIGNIYSNNIKNCKRKGIDAHSASNCNIYANTIENTLVGGIHLTGSDGLQEDINIYNNTLKNCGVGSLVTSTADSKLSIYSKYRNVNILNNKIFESGTNGAILVSSDNIKIENNNIINTLSTPPQYSYGLKLTNATNCKVLNNNINGKYDRGIELDIIDNVKIINNDVLENTPILEKTNINNLLLDGNKFIKPYLNKNNYKKYIFDITYNATTTPNISIISYDNKLPYSTLAGGSGYGFKVQTLGIDKNIFANYCYSEIILKSVPNDNIKKIVPISSISGSDLFFACSLKTSTGTEYSVDHSDLNGLKVRIIINLAIEM